MSVPSPTRPAPDAGATAPDAAAEEDPPTRPYRRILVILEDSPAAAGAVEDGVRLARAHHAELLFAQMVDDEAVRLGVAGAAPIDQPGDADTPDPSPASASSPHALPGANAASRRASAAWRAATKAGIRWRRVQQPLRDGARGIAELAQAQRCDLIVVATDGRNALVRLVSGSLVPGLVTLAPTPVWISRPRVEAARAAPHRRTRVRRASSPARDAVTDGHTHGKAAP